eukprot:CAMPEP_0176377496 /NCGR_PEP_ID=MMETSP0126-20121128/28930_1 /TAXON_ID=141414 ORGANISM="Strombidinopsis acuminatum, Strain SPMC142" /NCGR_SAMPLE_ID=MMETSP0126 /ASSEMBLY_ACC=CAM_ASM_000229 /LENGTH=39 /DNA_ID= /DNA_START= /DNA_END= /DNA_ORIENTATION=
MQADGGPLSFAPQDNALVTNTTAQGGDAVSFGGAQAFPA